MQLIELLPPAHVLAPLQSATLRAALAEILGRLAAGGGVRDAHLIEAALARPGAPYIVAAGPDVVLPHYRSQNVDQLLLGLGVAPDGLDARDLGLEVRPRVVALILAPTQAVSLYLQTVSSLARLLGDRGFVDRIVTAASADAVLGMPELAAMRLQPRLAVRDIMVHGVRAVAPGTAVRDAVDLMVRYRMRALPVVGEKQEVLGVVSEWDVMRGLLPQIPRVGQHAAETAIPESLRVKDVMTRSVLCVTEDLSIEEAASMMINKDVEQFPVTSEGRLTGFVTRGDIIRKLFGRH
jgi:CBS domain-containing protein/mannitol/fructose-specific phosphotransferase system IIA component (Ntr-type)